jgi:hypothetical protein
LEAAERLTEYPHWRTNSLDVTLRDPAQHCSLLIKHSFFAYSQDSSDLQLEQTRIDRAIETLPHELGVETFTRLGFLRRYLLAVPMDFHSLVSVMNVKLLSQDERLRTVLPPRLDDLMYRIDASDGDDRYHITAGPVHRAQVPALIDVNVKEHFAAEDAQEQLGAMEACYPDVGVFFDVDYFREGATPRNDAAGFVSTGRDAVHQLVVNLGEYILSASAEV